MKIPLKYLVLFIIATTFLSCNKKEKQDEILDVSIIQDRDRLWTIYNDNNFTDSVKIEALIQIARIYSFYNNDSALYLATRARDEAIRINNIKLEVDALNQQYFTNAALLNKSDENDLFSSTIEKAESIQYSFGLAFAHAVKAFHSSSIGLNEESKKSLKIIEQNLRGVPAQKTIVIDALRSYAWFYNREYQRCIEKAHQVVNEAQQLNAEGVLLPCYILMGLVYHSLENHEMGLKYNKLFVEIADKIGNKTYIKLSRNNLASGYIYLKQFDAALEQYAIYKSLAESDDSAHIEIMYLHGVAEIQDAEEKNQEAIITFKKVITACSQLEQSGWANYSRVVGSASKHLAELYFKQGNYEQALNYGLEGLKQHESLPHEMRILKILKIVADVYKRKNDFANYTEYIDKYLALYDSFNISEARKKVVEIELELFYKMEKDSIAFANQQEQLKAEKNQLKSEKQKNLVGAGMLFFLIVSGGVYSRYLVLGKKNKIIKEEMKRSDELLLNILPSETAKELKETGAAKAHRHNNVTVLVSDIKDFTRVGDAFSPEDLVAELDHCFSEFDRILSKYKVEKIKTVGDAYICAGGLPNPFDTSAIETAQVAIEMQNFILKYQNERLKLGKPYFEVRIGLHTGPVVAGIVGIKKFAYDIWGDTVNIAARMEQNCEVGRINVSSATQEKLKDKFTFENRGKVDVKGKGEMEMFYLSI